MGIYSSFKDRSNILAIGNIGFLFTYDLYLSNFAFITLYAPFNAMIVQCSSIFPLHLDKSSPTQQLVCLTDLIKGQNRTNIR